MGLPRSTFYVRARSARRCRDARLDQRICDEFEAYGWRRVGAALRHQGVLANHKRIRRLMREL